MPRPCPMVYSTCFLLFLPAVVSAQTNSGESRTAAQEQQHGGCLEAPAPDAPPSMCVPALAKNENDADAEAIVKPTAKIDLRVPEGTTLRIDLDQRTRISHPGDAVHGKVLFEERGCEACHSIGEGANMLGGDFAANLSLIHI